jgi:hypothetical protein
MRQKKPWEIKEEELLARENAYLENFNWFEKIIDSHWYYPVCLLIVSLVAFNLGLLIGFML